MRSKPPRSLKARALQLLAQREQSRVELRRKLLAYLEQDDAKAEQAGKAAAEGEGERGVCARDVSNGPPAPVDAPARAPDSADSADPMSRVDAVLDWLAAKGLASDERFAESRVHARSSRYGNLRIRQELKQHAVTLPPETQQALAASEEARAATVYQRRYDMPPATPAETAKRARFLAARGFSPDVIRRVLRSAGGRGPA